MTPPPTQELDLISQQHAAGLVTLRTDFTAAVNGLLPQPVVAGDSIEGGA